MFASSSLGHARARAKLFKGPYLAVFAQQNALGGDKERDMAPELKLVWVDCDLLIGGRFVRRVMATESKLIKTNPIERGD